MSKWIAEFELEDGDTMPEHMDLNYMGVNIDFHCRPLWISVSERLPKKSGNYWCTFGGTNLTGSDYYTTESDAKKIFDVPEEYVGWRSRNVIAWMPLPEPYKEVKDAYIN